MKAVEEILDHYIKPLITDDRYDDYRQAIAALTARENRMVQEARKDQIMRDFLAYSAEGENDESVDIAIREGLLYELTHRSQDGL